MSEVTGANAFNPPTLFEKHRVIPTFTDDETRLVTERSPQLTPQLLLDPLGTPPARTPPADSELQAG